MRAHLSTFMYIYKLKKRRGHTRESSSSSSRQSFMFYIQLYTFFLYIYINVIFMKSSSSDDVDDVHVFIRASVKRIYIELLVAHTRTHTRVWSTSKAPHRHLLAYDVVHFFSYKPAFVEVVSLAYSFHTFLTRILFIYRILWRRSR